ncbi:hypothetical protein [Enterococcus raffinosus]|uniref:hypothetical protein n=1 Tax=Enterococcus raffinosus TaxID=71452 RepID=UPI001C95F2C3|nr:hypothetical protein [Enterococcus raffinosus]QZO07896.1 hypothetical protein K5P74_08330 [Enterococcus raffinosus]
MSEIVIDPQEYYVWLACENGWNRAAGFKAMIAGMECSIVMVPTEPIEIVFSDLVSGSRILSLPISIIDLVMCDTKEKILVLMKENAHIAAKKIEYNGIDLVREESRKAKDSFEKKFGPMPDFEKTSVY